jgi:hypothetical protein
VSLMWRGRGGAAGRGSHSGNRSESSRNREMRNAGMKRGAEGDPTKIIIIIIRGAEVAIIIRMKLGKKLLKLRILGPAAATQSSTGVDPEKVKVQE